MISDSIETTKQSASNAIYQSGKLICAETKGEHLKNDDSREKIALGQAWRTAAGKDFRYYMVFENEENLLPGAMSMSQFIDTVKALQKTLIRKGL